MKIEVKSYSSSSSLFSSIIFFLLGAVLFTKPGAVVSFISYILGSILVLVSLVKFIIYWKMTKGEFPKPMRYLYLALVMFACGIVFIFFAEIVTNIIKFLLGAWILYCGINRLIFAVRMSFRKRKGLTLLILSLLLILLGLYVMLIPNILIKTIGLMVMIYSAIDIIGYIFYSTDKVPNEPKVGETTLIIPEKVKKEKIPRKEKKIKKIKKKTL